MQSIFRLPWCSDQIAPKMSENINNFDLARQSPVVDLSALAHLKRKRNDSNPDPNSLPRSMHKKPRADAPPQLPPLQTRLPNKTDFTTSAQPVAHPYATPLPTPHDIAQHDNASVFKLSFATPTTATSAYPDCSASPSNMASPDTHMSDAHAPAVQPADGLSSLQQVIDNEFNMQILMKHNELRLIEQELAKCQVALEQLRRCEVRPYPGMESPSPAVSAGTGPSVAPAPGFSRPSHPAPHGVVDGPYSRHYRHWLLHDPQFDSVPMSVLGTYSSSASSSNRPTRNSGVPRRAFDKSFPLPSSRSSASLPSIPNYPSPAPKDKSAPLVLRRSTDNQLVKLICNNCLRGNFSSIQGFLNHCRIAHKVDYKSHDLAAIDCGRPLDEQEAANLPAETASAPAPKPSFSRVASAAPTPYKNLVHPMNTPGGPVATSKKPVGRPLKAAIPPRKLSTKLEHSPLKTSSQAPRLSAHFAKHKLGGDLEQAIAVAKQKIDFGVEEVASPDTMDPESPSTPLFGGRTVAGVFNAGSLAAPTAVARPISRKGHRDPTQRPRPSPLAPTMHQSEDGGEMGSLSEHSPIVSPHTADSNPGLVSDHEDDDHGSQSEDETHHASAPAMPHGFGVRRDCSENMEIDVAVDDEMDEHGVVIRRNSMDATATRNHVVVKQQGARN